MVKVICIDPNIEELSGVYKIEKILKRKKVRGKKMAWIR